jgi:hypothetical protein
MLFGALADEAFRPLTGKYRHAYAAILRRLHDGLFSVDTMDQPIKQEVVREVADALDVHKVSLDQAESDSFKLSGQDAYAELIQCGWLSEQREGWAVFVEMEERVSRLVGTLVGLKERPDGGSFGGTMVAVAASIESAVQNPLASAQGVGEAAKRAREFARYTRSIVGTLKGIEKSMLAQASLNNLVKAFFDEFVDRIVIGDYRNLTLSRNHPYGFKWRIRDAAETILGTPELMSSLVLGLVSQGGASDAQAAEALLHRQLGEVSDALELIETFRHRIDLSKANVERRFANTLRYLDLIESGRADRFSVAMKAFGAALNPKRAGESEIIVAVGLFESPVHFDLALAAPALIRRPPIESHRFRQERPDPLRIAFDHAKSEFDRKLAITPQRFMDYIRAKVGGRQSVWAAELPPGDVEEMVIFSALLAQPGERIALPDGVTIRRRQPRRRIENDWIEFDDFVIEGAVVKSRGERLDAV